jgi:hypothetical protein
MGNKLMPTHWLHFWFFGFGSTVPIKSRTHCTEIVFVEVPNEDVGEVYGMNASAQLLQCNALLHKSFSNESPSPFPANFSVASDLAHLVVLWILGQRKCIGKTSPTFAIEPNRSFLSQRLVRTEVVVATQPEGGPMLLPTTGLRRKMSSLFFHHTMKLFVRTVVLGTGWTRQLYPYPQPNPPCTQTRKPSRPRRSKRSTVVDPNGFWHALFAKKLCKRCFYSHPALIGQQANQEAVTAEQIPHCQRFDSVSVASSKPPFEIHGPYMVGPSRNRQFGIYPHTRFARSLPPRLRHPHPLHPPRNRPLGWSAPSVLHKPALYLFWPPRRILLVN